jgi:hypothetical protein
MLNSILIGIIWENVKNETISTDLFNQNPMKIAMKINTPHASYSTLWAKLQTSSA